jgi:NAD-dependent deacetylase
VERSELEEQIERVADLIINSERIVVFTGAGVSTESGIPDFRSPGGIWSKYDPDDFTYQKFISSAETRNKHWKMFRETFSIEGAEPNPAHYAVAELEKMAKLDCVITQNVDSLHQKAGNTPEKVYELHGNVKWARCLSCDRRYPLEEMERRFEASGEAPDCEVCHGILKPDAVFFGEALPERTLREATWHSSHCDLFIVIGSTLVVYPAAFMPSYAVQSGAKLVIINLSSTPMDNQATVLIQGKAGEMMSRVMERVREKIKSS